MKKIIFVMIGILIITLVGCSEKNYDDLAKCLSEKGYKMYGTYWCTHCLEQKGEFGDSFKYVDYVECSTPDQSQTKECEEAEIRGYPTWVYPDGTRKEGAVPLKQLSLDSGCSLE